MKPTNSLLARYLRFVESRDWVAAEAFPVFARGLRAVLWTLAVVFAVTYALAGPIVRGEALRAILLVTLGWTLWWCVWAAGLVALFTLIFRLARPATPGKLTGKYLDAIGGYLPPDQPEDILAELAADIRSEMEDREAELGRPLTAEEVETILKRHGHPMLVAGRYLPRQYLIGPSTFPFYWFTLKTALWIAALVYVVVAVSVPFVRGMVQAAANAAPGEVTVAGAWSFLLIGALVLLAVFGAVTAVFAALESIPGFSPAGNWTVKSLSSAARPPRAKPRWEWMVGFVATGLFAGCWLAMPDFPWNLGPAGRYLMPGAAWASIRLAMILLLLAAMVEAGVQLARPQWTRFCTAVHVALRAAGLAFLGFLFHSSDSLVVVNLARVPAADAHRLPQIIVECTFYGSLMALLIAGMTDLVQCLPYLRRWFLRPDRERKGTSHQPAS
jgi:hypothetical protein